MSTEENKAIARRLIEEGFNQGNLAVLDEIVTADFVDHGPIPGLPPGREGFKQFNAILRAAFSDFHLTLEDVIADGDKVVLRMTGRGTHRGGFMGIAATGKEVVFTGIGILRLAGGKVVERWAIMDLLGLMQQLGAVPAPAGASR